MPFIRGASVVREPVSALRRNEPWGMQAATMSAANSASATRAQRLARRWTSVISMSPASTSSASW